MALAVANSPRSRPVAPQEETDLTPEEREERRKMGSLGRLSGDALRNIQEFYPFELSTEINSPSTQARSFTIKYPLRETHRLADLLDFPEESSARKVAQILQKTDCMPYLPTAAGVTEPHRLVAIAEVYETALPRSRAALFKAIVDDLPAEVRHNVPDDDRERVRYFKEHPQALQGICETLEALQKPLTDKERIRYFEKHPTALSRPYGAKYVLPKTFQINSYDWQVLPPELRHFCKNRLTLFAPDVRVRALPRLYRSLELPTTISPKRLEIIGVNTLRHVYAPRSKVAITGDTAATLSVEAQFAVFHSCDVLTQAHAKVKRLRATDCQNLNQITAKNTVWAATEECPQLTAVDAPYAKRNRHLVTLALSLVTLTTAVIMLPTLSLLWPPTWMVIALFCLTILTAILWGLLALFNNFRI